MQLGVMFPQPDSGSDPGYIREFAQAAEDLGYTHIEFAEHVLGGDPAHHPDLAGTPYSHECVIHEPFTTMAYLAGVTHKIGLRTGILILPQRQTVLVAKQAAQIDLLSNGRLELGLGVGWNRLEFEALQMNFED